VLRLGPTNVDAMSYYPTPNSYYPMMYPPPMAPYNQEEINDSMEEKINLHLEVGVFLAHPLEQSVRLVLPPELRSLIKRVPLMATGIQLLLFMIFMMLTLRL
jgi:hypothetical protein